MEGPAGRAVLLNSRAAKYAEQLIADAPRGTQAELKGIGELRTAAAVGDGRRGAASDDARANGEVEFVHQAGAEEGVVEFAAAFAEESAHVPLGA